MNTNSQNPKVGRDFQNAMAIELAKHFGIGFALEVPVPIGEPAHPHKFDCVSVDNTIFAECKCYTYTNGNNNPSAKFAALREALLYFSFLPSGIKCLILNEAYKKNSTLSLAAHFVNLNKHLLRDVTVLEYRPGKGLFKIN